jgi:hypothetical protein
MKKLMDYSNFWLIWLGCAGHRHGTTLYKIQDAWGITTNYLYHKEARLGRPLFQAMIEEGYIKKDKRLVKADFSWIPSYMIESHKVEKKGWSAGVLILENWPLVQDFIEKNREILFGEESLKILYKNIRGLKAGGRAIFDDIFIITLADNISCISEEYKARVVGRILDTIISLFPGRDLFGYFQKLRGNVKFPPIIKNDKEMLNCLRPQPG